MTRTRTPSTATPPAAAPSRRRGRVLGGRLARLRGDAERGSASLELAVLFPAVLLLVFGIVQYGLWFHARSLALAAAQEGVTAARTYTADPTAGPDRAHAFLAAHAGDLLTDITITTDTTPVQVRVQVTGRSLAVLPGVTGPSVSQAAQAPVERFTTPGAAP